MSHSEAEEEQRHFANVIASFKRYAQYSLSANNRRRQTIYNLPLEDRDILHKLGYRAKLDKIDQAILVNANFLDQMIAQPEIFGQDMETDEYGSPHEPLPEQGPPGPSHFQGHSHHEHPHDHGHSHSHGSHSHGSAYKPTEFDMDKIRSTLKQFVRDWSEEGKLERDVCYEPMKGALLQHFSDRHKLRVLVPGAGLGRLAYDVASLGFTCQGNEFSHYMLLASFFILNRTESIGKYTIFPYIHSFSNIGALDAMLRPIKIPDVLPTALPLQANFSLVAGDFEEVYGVTSNAAEPQHGKWDAILTCFFIDTAKNIINYLRIIHSILAPGGVWINLGPLLWHWENNTTNDLSVELTLEEVKTLARTMGFTLSNERTIETTYTNNSQSMLNYIYQAAFWTATKDS
ncbi:N2227-domain-containing protein [Pluteus cervinus]|uniref:N2227-domain-containing protein n=1 Tax=Pluteus cervinus TaxID=181527 RepID=A0ACD3BBS6_9AGAR|nr:N2227-domain-containing protein [Pluteus cervinus]